jgi:hypothetical protein
MDDEHKALGVILTLGKVIALAALGLIFLQFFADIAVPLYQGSDFRPSGAQAGAHTIGLVVLMIGAALARQPCRTTRCRSARTPAMAAISTERHRIRNPAFRSP